MGYERKKKTSKTILETIGKIHNVTMGFVYYCLLEHNIEEYGYLIIQ